MGGHMKIQNRTPFRFPVTLTNKAKDKMRELRLDERSLFSLQKSFYIYIEKYPQEAERLPSIALYLDREKNKKFAEVYKDIVVVLHCLVEKDKFLVVNVTTRSAQTPVATNWRRAANLTFQLHDNSGERLSYDLLDLIHTMPVAQESSMYVKKRITSWEGYLRIQERSADIPDMTTRYSKLVFNGNFSRVTITGIEIGTKEWKSLKDLSVKLKGIDQDIGKVIKANRSEKTVEVELHGYMEERARKQQLHVHPKEVVFSNFATLSQVKRLRQGFKHLESGRAVNPNLERLLFENKPPVEPIKKPVQVKFHNRLNDFQQKAVIGAMSAKDLYVIQGPPGTGKTTVISEICLQNARAGLKTLVASQSNLAVDNALGRLLANKDIRILRVGRTESIEEEGQKFIEENVGQYWKDHTFHEVSSQYQAREKRESVIETELVNIIEEQSKLEIEREKIEAELKVKQDAKAKWKEIQAVIVELKQQVQVLKKEEESSKKQLTEHRQQLQRLNVEIEEDTAFLKNQPDEEALEQKVETNKQLLEQLRQSVACHQLESELEEKNKEIETTTAECENWLRELDTINALTAKVKDIKQVDGLKWMLLEQGFIQSEKIEELLEKIEDIRYNMQQLEKLRSYYEKLNRAIAYMEERAKQKGVILKELHRQATMIQAQYTAADIDDFLEQLRDKIRNQENLYRTDLEGLYSRTDFIKQKAKRFQRKETYVHQAQQAFRLLKQEIIEEFERKQLEAKPIIEKSKQMIETVKSERMALQEKLKQMKASIEVIPNANELLPQKEAQALELKEHLQQMITVRNRLKENEAKRTSDAAIILEEKQTLTQIETRLREKAILIVEKEQEQEAFNALLSTEPEQKHEQVLTQVASLSLKQTSLEEEKRRLPLFQSVQGKWLALLKEANEHDLDEIRKLYVKHANVIGTTCVASARKDFIDTYPAFDVVIIDEVSKATPPELLLPMLKGKKIILVGDHHQLPPLLGDDTLEETLQEMADGNGDFEGKEELNKLLKESLFERLFKNLPKSHKTMLAIQYRMHENIMETIAPFYEQENERLQCGLTNSDFDRDHKLESIHIKRDNHFIWMAMPNESAFFEERMKGGKSLYNPAELNKIADMLKEIDEAVFEAKQAGRMKEDEQKSVGVISFYGEQVKRIDRLLQQELRLQHVTLRTGTVDRFQGMEMDVIIVSMVRNHENKHDDIGFAKDYRRLNVALSRARELLVLIGSTTMFTERPKQATTRNMYKHVFDVAQQQNGLRLLEEVK